MRFIKAVISVCVVFMVLWVGFLAIRSLQLEGASLKTCVLISGPFLIWLAYQGIDLIIDKLHSIEGYKSTIKTMQTQIDLYIDMERAIRPRRLMKCIQECRQSAQAIKHPGIEDISLTLSRLRYIDHLLNDIAPTLLRILPEYERQRWGRAINALPAIQSNMSEEPLHSPMNDEAEENQASQLSSNNQNKAVEEINCLKKTTSATNEMSDWQDLAASLERRVDEQH